MKDGNGIALLFDFDGVIVDTEKMYSVFWDDIGRQLLNMEGLGKHVKGSTLNQILATYFRTREDLVPTLMDSLDKLEAGMTYDYIPGVEDFLTEARERGFHLAVVTSSNMPKMLNVYSRRPELKARFDEILTSEDFSASKPDPDCYRKAMARFGTDTAHSVVFEDSVNGLKSGKASGALVIGLTTTNPREIVAEYSSLQVPDFTDKERIFDYILTHTATRC